MLRHIPVWKDFDMHFRLCLSFDSKKKENWPHTKEDQTGEEDESDAETHSSLFQWTWKNLCFVWKWEQTYMEIAWSLNVYLSKGYKPLLNTIVVHLKFGSFFTYHCTIAQCADTAV